MSKCSRCNQEITFQPHPKSPEKLAPFDIKDGKIGEMHFVTCKAVKQKTEYKTMEDLESLECKHGHPCRFVLWKRFEKSDPRLEAKCIWGHWIGWIPITDGNKTWVKKTQVINNPIAHQWEYISLKEAVEVCLNYENDLSDWGKKFINAIKNLTSWRELTIKQQEAFNQTWRKLGCAYHDLFFQDRIESQQTADQVKVISLHADQ